MEPNTSLIFSVYLLYRPNRAPPILLYPHIPPHTSRKTIHSSHVYSLTSTETITVWVPLENIFLFLSLSLSLSLPNDKNPPELNREHRGREENFSLVPIAEGGNGPRDRKPRTIGRMPGGSVQSSPTLDRSIFLNGSLSSDSLEEREKNKGDCRARFARGEWMPRLKRSCCGIFE